jgi:C1A family cysteine protease
MEESYFGLLSITVMATSIQLSSAMDQDHHSESLENKDEIKHIYNLQPSLGTESYEWLTQHATEDKLTLPWHVTLPEKVDFRKDIPYIHDQEKLGSCTAQALTLSMEYILKKNSPAYYRPLSPLFVYYNTRKLENTILFDKGATLSGSIKMVCEYGVCSEDKWSYSDYPVKFRQEPNKEAYEDAKKTVDLDVLGESHVPHDLDTIKYILAQEVPIVFGINVYSSFESPEVELTGKVPMPNLFEKRLGGHAMTLVGYNDKKKYFYFANSWGEKWGKKGFGKIPYDYIMNPWLTYSYEFWKVEQVGPKTTS